MKNKRTVFTLRPGPDEGNPQGIFGPRHLPGGDIKMTVMKIGEPGPDLFKDYSWLRSVRWEPPKTILAQVGLHSLPGCRLVT
jgi:hypothetical protein